MNEKNKRSIKLVRKYKEKFLKIFTTVAEHDY